MKAAQVGATEAGNNWIGFAIHQAPGPMLAVQPTVELAKRNSRQRIDPLIDESPELRERVKPARSRDAGNTMLSKEFAGGILIMTGANSAVGLRSSPARYIFLDEVDAYPASADEEGDPVTLAEARSLTFAHRRKVFLVSTPTIRGLSPHRAGVRGQRPAAVLRAVPALRRDAMAEVRPAALAEGPAGDGGVSLRGLRAAHRGAPQDGDAGGRRMAGDRRRPPIRPRSAIHLSALYSPIGWLSWERIVRAWEAAQGSDEAIKAFRNTILGETWVETGRSAGLAAALRPARALDIRHGARGRAVPDRRRRRAEGPDRGRCLGLGSRAGKLARRSRRDRGRAAIRHDAWSELTALLDRTWPHERGAHLASRGSPSTPATRPRRSIPGRGRRGSRRCRR